jgi:hypothetical protein
MFENAFNNINNRPVLRNDEGLASELDYAEQTSWLLFLKYLDDLEAEHQDEAELEGHDYTPIIDAEYSWKTWAAPKDAGRQARPQRRPDRRRPDRLRQPRPLPLPQGFPRKHRDNPTASSTRSARSSRRS